MMRPGDTCTGTCRRSIQMPVLIIPLFDGQLQGELARAMHVRLVDGGQLRIADRKAMKVMVSLLGRHLV